MIKTIDPAETADNLKDLVMIFQNLITTKFYGALEIKLESGKVVLIRKTENIKIGR